MAPSLTATTTDNCAPFVLKSNNLPDNITTNGYLSDGAENARSIVHDALKSRISSIDVDACEAGEEEAFFVADMGEVYRQHLRWKMNLKKVKPHYGMSWRNKPSHGSVADLIR